MCMKKSLVVLISVIFLSLSIWNSNILVENLPTEYDVKSSGNNQSSVPSTISLLTNGSYIEEAMTIISSTPTDVIRNIQVSNQNGTVKVIHFLTDTNIWNLDTWNGNEWIRQSFFGNSPHTSHFSTNGFKGEYFLYNHTFYKTTYSIGNSCNSATWVTTNLINISIFEVEGQGSLESSTEQCLPSLFGIVEFDIIGDRVGYVVSGQGNIASSCNNCYTLYYRADSGIVFNLLNNSQHVLNFGNRVGSTYGLSSNGNGYPQNSEDFAILDNMSCLIIKYSIHKIKCHDDSGNQIIQTTIQGAPYSIMKDNNSVFIHTGTDPTRIIKIDSNLNINSEYNTGNIDESTNIYSSIILGYVSTSDGKIYSAIQNTTIEIGTEFLLSIGNGTKQISENFIEIRKDNLGNTDLYTLWHDSDNDTISNDFDEFPFEISQNIDTDNDGFGDNPNGFAGDTCPSQSGTSTLDVFGCLDTDNDGYSNNGDKFPFENSQWNDTDFDGYGDNFSGTRGDDCPTIYGTSTRNNTLGCPDTDYDGWADSQDVFDNESSQWADVDGDGYGDQLIGFQGDACPFIIGNSSKDRFGCIDSDGDAWSDDGDDLPLEISQWKDRDGDGYGENLAGSNPDAFPSDGTQWVDFDGDGHGDNPYGTEGDWFPNDPTRWQDTDRDGVADEDDAFINEATQWNDTDGDGYGDEAFGNRADAFPLDASEWSDSDSDGLGNNADAFPYDPSQKTDRDGDGFGDNSLGTSSDKFPDDSSQWSDIDGDSYGDNQTGNNSDAFITDATQWSDLDGDGYGDNPTGRQADEFPNDSTQWLDQDGDGFGDNQSGNNPDPYLFDFDNDGYNDSIDPLPKLASPGDLDNDGTPDIDDIFPEDFREWADSDGDGEGDNADPDDDNDGWADTDEMREGTDPFSSSSQPVNSFEIVLPGTTIGLGAWDLIGMFGGIPLFCWIGFGFATRNGRTAKYETRLRESNTRDELEGVARQWEYSLMLRLLGPHQGIRLERLRAELDDRFEHMNQKLTSIDGEPNDQTHLVMQEMAESEKIIPSLESLKPSLETIGLEDGKGYEWFTDSNDGQWYRVTGSNSEWEIFQS